MEETKLTLEPLEENFSQICCICFEKTSHVMQCQHFVCPSCILHLSQDLCPYCRQRFDWNFEKRNAFCILLENVILNDPRRIKLVTYIVSDGNLEKEMNNVYEKIKNDILLEHNIPFSIFEET